MPKSTVPSRRIRSAGEGTIFPTPDGRHRGIVTWTDPDGTRHRRYVRGATSEEVVARIADLRRELRLGTIVPPGRKATVGDWLTEWIDRDRAHVRPSTWRTRETHVRVYLVPELGRIPLTRLSPRDVERALQSFMAAGRTTKTGKVRKPASAQTVRHVRATLRIALADAVRDGRVGRNAAADARPPYVAHRPVVYLEAAQVRQLLEATKDDEYGAIYALAVTTGLRLGELLGLTWTDVAGGTITVRRSLAVKDGGGWELATPKSARSRRTLPQPAAAREALRRQAERQDAAKAEAGTAWQDREGLVFTDAVGRPLRPHNVSAAFTRALKAAGIPHVAFHATRHTAATLMLAQGVPITVISEWLGHAGIAITVAHYAAVVPTLHLAAADATDRAIGGES